MLPRLGISHSGREELARADGAWVVEVVDPPPPGPGRAVVEVVGATATVVLVVDGVSRASGEVVVVVRDGLVVVV